MWLLHLWKQYKERKEIEKGAMQQEALKRTQDRIEALQFARNYK